MPHRYWRISALEAYGAEGLELSCCHLLSRSAARLDASATLTASRAPSYGTVAALQDDDLTTAVGWPVQLIAQLALTWDFGGNPVDVANIQLAGSRAARFPLFALLQSSDNGDSWTTQDIFAGISYPLAGLKTDSVNSVNGTLGLQSCLDFDGEHGATSMADLAAGRVFTAYGNAKISTASPLVGTGSLELDGAGDYISTTQGLGDFVYGTGDFHQTVKVKLPAAAREMVLLDFYDGTSGSWELLVTPSGVLTWYSGGYVLTGSINLRDGLPHDIEASRTGSVLRFFVDGTLDGAVADPRNYDAVPSSFSIGAQVARRNPAYDLLGQVDEFTSVKGVGGHTASFVPSTTPLYFPRIRLNRIRGRAAPAVIPSITTGVPTVYGAAKWASPSTLTIESGAVKDYASGVLGTGRGRVRGTVKQKGSPDSPVYRRVALLRERDNFVVRPAVWSDPVTGEYSFDFIDELQVWAVLSNDYPGKRRSVVASGLTLENGGVELIA